MTPPAGVRAQTAPPLNRDSWEGELTPLPDSTRLALEQVDRRVKSGGHATLDRVDEVSRRVDMVRGELRGDIEGVNGKVDGVNDRVSELAVRVSSMDGKLDLLVRDRDVDRQELSAVRIETVRADLEIRKSIKIAEVDDDRDRRRHRRIVWRRALSFALKLVGAGGAIWGVVSATLLARGC